MIVADQEQIVVPVITALVIVDDQTAILRDAMAPANAAAHTAVRLLAAAVAERVADVTAGPVRIETDLQSVVARIVRTAERPLGVVAAGKVVDIMAITVDATATKMVTRRIVQAAITTDIMAPATGPT